MKNNKVISLIRKDLKKSAKPEVKKSGQRFFKEKVKLYGVKSAIVGKIAKEYFREIKEWDKKEIFGIAEELFKSDYCEEAFIACNFVYWQEKRYEKSDFKIFLNWIRKYINNWAKCDTFCNHSMGAFIKRFPEYVENLKSMTKSDNRWVRRASAVSLIVPARKGEFFEDILEICDILLKDEDDMVQKGYGWLLKEASKAHLKEVFDYVMRNKREMPRTSLRYAIEKFPEDLRKKALGK